MRIRVGRCQNIKTGKMEVIWVYLPMRMFIHCKWCGELRSNKMYLIKREEDMDPLEKQYSDSCPCRIDFSPTT